MGESAKVGAGVGALLGGMGSAVRPTPESGGAQSYTEAAYWYSRAAETAHYGAQAALGWLYARGLGVERDMTFAFFWLLVASAQGSVDAEMRRDHVALVLTPDQINRAQRAALDWEPARH